MPKVRFACADGVLREVVVGGGTSVMEAAVKEGVPGIVAECGGAAACATCHVYVDPAYAAIVGEPDDLEDEMLDEATAERRATSRLSCQIELDDALDGLLVEIAGAQQ